MKKIVIYTDGSCLGNPGAGGWGTLIMTEGKEVVLRGGESETTNNRMEMIAVVEALKWLSENGEGQDVQIFSDSSLVINSMKEGWKRKKNLDIWEEMDKSFGNLKDVNIEWNWVKGHSDNKFNQRVDKIAVEESMKQPTADLSVKSQKTGNGYYCDKCEKETEGVLSLLPDSEMIRVDCANCGKYIMFAENNPENMKRARKRVLLSKAQMEKVVKIKEERGETVGENDLKKLKIWTKEEADTFIKGDQTLF
ncbi:ribonuclease H [Patescibacteria group bacterium]